jgi:opacity protein-like surface antigen
LNWACKSTSSQSTLFNYIDADANLPVRPFLSIGIGGTLYRPTNVAKAIARDPLRGNLGRIDSSSELTFNYGIGLKAKISDRIGFHVDGRGFVSRTPSFGFARESTDPHATVFPAGGAFHNAEASAGLIFYLN